MYLCMSYCISRCMKFRNPFKDCVLCNGVPFEDINMVLKVLLRSKMNTG
jgi:hypothetical protein